MNDVYENLSNALISNVQCDVIFSHASCDNVLYLIVLTRFVRVQSVFRILCFCVHCTLTLALSDSKVEICLKLQ
jgi:hypothetical protein